MPDGQELTISYQRRERFTFRERHLEILEAFFKDNPYPSYEQREAIADTCNLAISNDGNSHLYLFTVYLQVSFSCINKISRGQCSSSAMRNIRILRGTKDYHKKNIEIHLHFLNENCWEGEAAHLFFFLNRFNMSIPRTKFSRFGLHFAI